MNFYDHLRESYMPWVDQYDFMMLMNDFENDFFEKNPKFLDPKRLWTDPTLEKEQNDAIEAAFKKKYSRY
jgi:hypothetical protein